MIALTVTTTYCILHVNMLHVVTLHGQEHQSMFFFLCLLRLQWLLSLLMSRRAIASGGFRVVVPVQRVALAVAVAWEGEGQEGQGAGHGQGGQGGHPESFHNSSHGSGISGSFRGSHGHNGRSDGNAHNVSDSEAHPNSPPNNDIWISEVLVLNEKSDLRLHHTQDQNSQNTSQKRSHWTTSKDWKFDCKRECWSSRCSRFWAQAEGLGLWRVRQFLFC